MAWPDVTRVDTQPVTAPLAASDRLVVVLDQFEELFRRAGSRPRADFFRELADALDKPECDVRFVFSLREDYLPQLDEARRIFARHPGQQPPACDRWIGTMPAWLSSSRPPARV